VADDHHVTLFHAQQIADPHRWIGRLKTANRAEVCERIAEAEEWLRSLPGS
jgi:hypothetical protein